MCVPFLYRNPEWKGRSILFAIVGNFLPLFFIAAWSFSRGSQTCVRWRIKCQYIKILFRRFSKYWRSRIEICIDSEIGKIFPYVKENVRLRWWQKRDESWEERQEGNWGPSRGIRPDEGKTVALNLIWRVLRSIQTRFPATRSANQIPWYILCGFSILFYKMQHAHRVFSRSFYLARQNYRFSFYCSSELILYARNASLDFHKARSIEMKQDMKINSFTAKRATFSKC